MISTATFAFFAAFLLGLVLTRSMRRWAPRLRLTDRPDRHRKLHPGAVPLGGGIAVFVATAIVVVGLWTVDNPCREVLAKAWREVLGGVAGAAALLLGLADDRFGVRGIHKLAGQILVALLVVAGGLCIHNIELFGIEFQLGIAAVPFTVFWLLGAMNSVNLLDGIDGLAATLGVILSGTVAIMAAMTGQPAIAIIAIVFAGALFGFLRFNFPPASIFLGDAGSMLIGLTIGLLVLRASLKGPGTVLLAAPLAVWTIPVFDSAAAILRRKLTGRSIYAVDRAHLHHRLFAALGSNRRVLAVVVLAAATTCGAALVSISLKNDLVALVAGFGVVAIFVASDLFGRAEMVLLVNRLGISRALFGRAAQAASERGRASSVRLQGTRQWEILWATLTESAEKLNLTRIRLDVSLPAMSEEYNAVWRRGPTDGIETCWRIELPLIVHGHPAGSLAIAGERNGAPVREYIEQLLDLLEPFEMQLAGFAGQAMGNCEPGAGNEGRMTNDRRMTNDQGEFRGRDLADKTGEFPKSSVPAPPGACGRGKVEG